MNRCCWLLALVVVSLLATVDCCRAVTLEEARARGVLRCGTSTGLPGFSNPDDQGNWTGIDADFCRAMAAAVFGDATRVEFVPVADREHLSALLSGEVDVLARNVSWTLTEDTSLGLNFVGVSYYDGQGFLVRQDLKVGSALELNDVSVCFEGGGVEELRLRRYFAEHQLEFRPLPHETREQAFQGFASERCEVLSGSQLRLYLLRNQLPQTVSARVLPEVISKNPLGPVVRQGDDGWFNIARWTLFALLNGEELGLASTTIERLRDSPSAAVRRFLGQTGIGGKGLGLSDDWAYQIIRQVGNYGEIFERNLGQSSGLNFDRGLNQLWNSGGLHFAPPFD